MWTKCNALFDQRLTSVAGMFHQPNLPAEACSAQPACAYALQRALLAVGLNQHRPKTRS